MAELNLSSGITFREEPPRTRLITGVQTSILAAVGVTERGPEAATKVTSFDEYLKIFGGDHASSELVPAVRGFFDEGGRQAWIKRVVHYTNIESAGTRQGAKGSVTLQSEAGSPGVAVVTGTVAGPWALSDGDTLDFSVNAGATDPATFNADAAVVTGTNTETFVMSDGMTLLVEIDNGTEQTITFLTSEFANIALATAAEVAAVINAKIIGASATVSAGAVRITSDLLGTDSDVTITGGTSAAVLGLTGATDAGGGDAADASAVTAAEMKLLIEGDVTGVVVSEAAGGELRVSTVAAGAGESVQVEATSTADGIFGFDNAVHSGTSGAAADALEVEGKTDGAYTDDIQIRIEDATSGAATEFNLKVEVDGVVEELFPNLTMDPTAARFALSIINATNNGSNLIAVAEPAVPAQLRPANGLSAALAGGDDGLTGLGANDFIGSETTETGLRGFDKVTDASLLIVPGQTGQAVQLAMLTYVEDTRGGNMFTILDPPAGYTAAQMVTHVETTNQLLERSEYGCVMWPRIKVLNPNETIYGTDESITIYPSGHIAGRFAKTDSAAPGGVYRASAGIETGRFSTVLGLETDEVKDKRKRDLLYPKRINPISIIGSQIAIDGVRTLLSTGNFPTIPERRGVIFIEVSLQAGLEFARFRNNDSTLRAEVRRAIYLFLLQQMRRGAFRTKKPATAFTVDVSDELNPESVILAGQLIIKIGLATAKPAEFINMVFTQDTRALDEELAQAGL